MTRNSKLLNEFVEYCMKHPDGRFWQALRNWSEQSFVFVGAPVIDKQGDIVWPVGLADTFHWEGKKK